MPPGVGSPLQDLYQVRLMHQPLSKVVRNADGTAKPLPPQVSPDVDFHKMVGAMGQYPKLMRALGLALDLEIAPDNVPPTGLVPVTPSLQGAPPLTPWTAYRFDGRRLFVAASGPAADIADGMLSFQGPDDYEVVQVDLDGAAEKVLDFVRNLSRVAYNEVASTIDTPERYGLPSLRSAGFSAARSGRAVRLVNTFQNARNNNVAAVGSPNASSVVLHADDVTRGYRIDVWDSMSSAWHSLCQRDGTYRLLNGPLTLTFSDEGFADGRHDAVRRRIVHRSAPPRVAVPLGGLEPVGPTRRTVGSDSTPQPAGNTASTDAKLETDFTVTKGTLPRLRFGALYQFRARAVDLAGNSLPPGAVLDDTYNIPPQPVPYQRYEPVVAPVVVLREPLGADTTPGESVERIVVRSNFDTHIAAVSERHIAPPKTAHDMAEAHGMLDTPAGPPDKALYATLVAKDGSLDVDAAHPDAPVPHAEAQLALPYLPDPCAVGAAFRTLPGDGPGVVRRIAFDGAWPDTRPFRIALDEGSGPPAFVENATERVLTVHLPKADVATVALSSYVTDRDTSQPPRILSTMAIWSWIVDANPPDLDALKRLALEGGHWMITPPRTLTLVHAVQKPLIEPQFQHLTSRKILGQTFATITDELPISGKSTIRLDIDAEWQETLDDMTSAPQPVIRPGSTRAFAETIGPTQTVAVVDGRHEFHDTRHRMVSYTAVATTRFREYFPPALTADPANLTRTSEPVEIAILSSARPASPRPLYVIPTFGWGSKDEGAWDFSRRAGGGLRVYLDRPWYSSGEGELLGAVLWGCEPPEHAAFRAFEVPDLLKGYVTQWGMDPIWNAPPPPSQAAPRPEHFRNAVAIGHGLTLDELADRPTIPLSVAGHSVVRHGSQALVLRHRHGPGQCVLPVRAPGPRAVSAALRGRRAPVARRARRLHPARARSIGVDHDRPARGEGAPAGRDRADLRRSGRVDDARDRPDAAARFARRRGVGPRGARDAGAPTARRIVHVVDVGDHAAGGSRIAAVPAGDRGVRVVQQGRRQRPAAAAGVYRRDRPVGVAAESGRKSAKGSVASATR